MAEPARAPLRDEYELELENMVTDLPRRSIAGATANHRSPRKALSSILSKKFLWTSALLLMLVAFVAIGWVLHRSSNKQQEMDDYDENDERLPQLRSYISMQKSHESDRLGHVNIFVRKDPDDRRRTPERFRFPAAYYRRQEIPVNGPFFHFMPRVPIFADRLTKQTLICATPGGVYILPPLVNAYGRLFSIAELIASGYASLVSSGAAPTGPINMAPLFYSTPLIGSNVPVLRPRRGGFIGGIRTKLESLSIPKDYYRSSNLHSTLEMDEDDSDEHDSGEDEDYDRSSYSRQKFPRKTTSSVKTTTSLSIIEQVQKKLKQATSNLVGTFKQGICVEVMFNTTVRAQFIADNLIGRVQPVGTFSTTELAVEYLYGLLCGIPNLPPRLNLYENVDALQLTYDPNYYRVSFKFQVNLTSKKKLIFFGIAAFNEELKLCGYEAVIQNPGLTLDFPPDQRQGIIVNLCQAVQTICPVGSPYVQYAKAEECVSFLSETQTPFGSFDRADQDNVVCRLNHIQLASIVPRVHCPHVGKSGGGACTNKTSEWYFEEPSDFVKCAYQYRQ